MRLTRRTFLAATLASAALPARAGSTRSLGGPAFGSYWRITLPETADPAPVRAAIAAVVAGVDRLMSPYRADTELGQSLEEARPPAEGPWPDPHGS